MEENEVSIPFDLKHIRDNTLKKAICRLSLLCKSIISRTIDILFGLVLLVLLIPSSIILKLIYISNGDFKSIFTVTKCFGKKGRIINVIKYRSVNKDGTENRLKATSLDALPEAINLLIGNMSIVGPKPYKIEEKERMGTFFDRIVKMKPGVTGLAQISYASNYLYDMRLDNDSKYYYRKNMFLDIKIILITLLITIPRKFKGQVLSGLVVSFKNAVISLASLINRFLKRTIDIIGAIIGIVLLVPLTIIVVIHNHMSGDKGPIFYVQDRIGKDGKPFKVYKFRTMVVGADEKLVEILEQDSAARKEFKKYKKLKKDPRITKAGKFLRKTSLDEFPQFINVLKGEMSLVGPRPYLFREHADMEGYYDIIVKYKPGITGLWQISGRSNVTFKDRLEMDMKYHKEANIARDVKILCKTVINVFKNDNAA